MKKNDVFKLISQEVAFAQQWDKLPTGERPIKDSEKSVEFWLLHIERYLNKAKDGCSGTDKTIALENIRKIAGLCVTCMMNNETPPRYK